jgi:membrane fusion protein, multidrug efflux system
MTAKAHNLQPLLIEAREAHVDGQVLEVSAQTSARVQQLCVAENQRVQKGELLIALDPRELDRRVAAAALEFDKVFTASLAGNAPRAMRDAHPPLTRIEIEPTAELQKTRAAWLHAKLRRRNADVRAPVSGTILRLKVSAGEFVGVAQPIVSILDGDVWVVAHFAPADFAFIRVGQNATVVVNGQKMKAWVDALAAVNLPVAVLKFADEQAIAVRPRSTATVVIESQ